jgi:hypothetical protein
MGQLEYPMATVDSYAVLSRTVHSISYEDNGAEMMQPPAMVIGTVASHLPVAGPVKPLRIALSNHTISLAELDCTIDEGAGISAAKRASAR